MGARSCNFGVGSWCHLRVATPPGAEPEVSSAGAWLNGEEGWTTIPQIPTSRKATEIGTAAGRLQPNTEKKCKVLCLWQSPREKLN